MSEGIRVFLSTFALLFVAELGDKTQLAVISMTAKHKAPIWVFLGAALALAAVTGLGVIGGEFLTRLIPEGVLRKVAAAGFAVMGLLMWFDKL
jgi:putative Ca2+/H+ antiporter (TMEM165/GDT1 family)